MDIISKNIQAGVDRNLGAATVMVNFLAGKEEFDEAKQRICDRVIKDLPIYMKPVEDYADVALGMEETLREKLGELPPDEFEGMLHPVFQEDEWKLILIYAQ